MGDLIPFWLQDFLCTELRIGVHIAQHYFSPNNKPTPLIWEVNYQITPMQVPMQMEVDREN